ncbi:MAG: hypothetical protein EHM70_10745 [Chloroflexota bacterium]|nr:MAG: hypothetical protein EHM70_10745 [Chloroflexota bacterium]
MDNNRWVIDTSFKLSNGKQPIHDFFDTLTPNEFHYVENALDRLEKYGPDIGRPTVDYLEDHICELRVRVGRVNVRLLFFRYNRNLVFLVGLKKYGSIPKGQLMIAKERRIDYLANIKKGL